MTSARTSSSGSPTSRAPCSPACSSVRYGSWATTRISKPFARRATALPILPRPMMPSVRCRSSLPVKRPRSHSPVRSDASAAGTWRRSASISAMVCSAAAMVLPVGALTTITPARVAAPRSIRSVPTEATPITDRRGAAASSSAASTRVCERTTSPSQPPSSASAASSASRESPVRTRTSWEAARTSRPASAIGSATRMRAIDRV